MLDTLALDKPAKFAAPGFLIQGSPVKSSDVSRCDRQGSVIVMNEIPNSPDVIFYSF